jgi:hypothetical protein
MTVQVPLIEVTREFHKAHEQLVTIVGGADLVMRKSEFLKIHHLNIMRDAWKEHYNIKIIESNLTWLGLEFIDEKQYTCFLIKWS